MVESRDRAGAEDRARGSTNRGATRSGIRARVPMIAASLANSARHKEGVSARLRRAPRMNCHALRGEVAECHSRGVWHCPYRDQRVTPGSPRPAPPSFSESKSSSMPALHEPRSPPVGDGQTLAARQARSSDRIAPAFHLHAASPQLQCIPLRGRRLQSGRPAALPLRRSAVLPAAWTSSHLPVQRSGHLPALGSPRAAPYPHRGPRR
jgi:hypothetical protein